MAWHQGVRVDEGMLPKESRPGCRCDVGGKTQQRGFCVMANWDGLETGLVLAVMSGASSCAWGWAAPTRRTKKRGGENDPEGAEATSKGKECTGELTQTGCKIRLAIGKNRRHGIDGNGRAFVFCACPV